MSDSLSRKAPGRIARRAEREVTPPHKHRSATTSKQATSTVDQLALSLNVVAIESRH